MNVPAVSVILPVYNAGLYLREAIDSVLRQTLTDFEFLIINDGSTDASEATIRSYTDPRIVYVKNEHNCGLIYTLNKGIELASGKYIARMDSDDNCLPQRFEKQVRFLETSDAVIVASTVEMIDAQGKTLPPWRDDRNHVSPAAIRSFLPKDNSIAHPSIMAKTSILKSYGYRHDQKEAEDYDLWLRLAADGKQICKLDEPLLEYRFLQDSLSRKERLSAAERLYRTKKRFIQQCRQENKQNTFVLKVALYCYVDFAKATLKKLIS